MKKSNEASGDVTKRIWSFCRPGFGKFDVDNIDTSLCTHGFYGFADLNNRTEDPHVWELVAYDPW